MVKIESIIRFTDEPNTEGNGCFVSGQRNQNSIRANFLFRPRNERSSLKGLGNSNFAPARGKSQRIKFRSSEERTKTETPSFVFLFGKKRIKFKYISNISLIHPNQE